MNTRQILPVGLTATLLAFICLNACKEDDAAAPLAPELSFDKQVTIVDDTAKFSFLVSNPGRVVIDEIGIFYREDVSGAVEQNVVIETNTNEDEKTVVVKLKLSPNKRYWLGPYLSSAPTNGRVSGEQVSVTMASPRWSTRRAFPGKGRDKAAVFALGSNVYVGLGKTKTELLRDFWVYDVAGDTWKQLADFPGDARYDVVTFALNGKGYVGGGNVDGETDSGALDFWQYDPEGDIWLQIDDLPYPLTGGTPSTFLGAVSASSQGAGVAYYGAGSYYGFEMSDMYRFDPADNSWVAIDDLPIEGFNLCSFMIGNRLYVGMGKYHGTSSIAFTRRFFMYDPSTGDWTERAAFPDGVSVGLFADRLTSFAIDDFGYIMTNEGELWKYDAANDNWIKDQNAELIYRNEDVPANRMVGVSNTQIVVAGKTAFGGLGIINTYINDVYIHTPGTHWMSFDPTK